MRVFEGWDPSGKGLIEGDSKRYARVRVIETVIERIEQGMRQWGMEPPPPLKPAKDD